MVAKGLSAIEAVGDGAGAGTNAFRAGKKYGFRAGAATGAGAGAGAGTGADAGAGNSDPPTLYVACSCLESLLHSWPKVCSLTELRKFLGRNGRCSWQKTA